MTLRVRETPGKGVGVFTTEPIRKGQVVLQFRGPVMTRAHIPQPLRPEDDHYLQIGRDVFIGPSGLEDDYVNHSCDPNCMVVIDEEARLVAMQDIAADQEITFDYSTTSTDEPEQWFLVCRCGSQRCRGLVSGFEEVGVERQRAYIAAGAVPAYVLAGIMN